MGFLVITQSLVKSETRYSFDLQIFKGGMPTSCGECVNIYSNQTLDMGGRPDFLK